MQRAHTRPRGSSRARARDLHKGSIIIDGQGVAALLPVINITQPSIDPKEKRSYLDRAVASGLTAMNVSMGIGGIGLGEDDFRSLLGTIHGYLAFFELKADYLVHVQTVNDIYRAKREGKVGVIFGVQGLASKIDNDLNFLTVVHKLGMRICQLTYNERNAFGCGCAEVPDTGLTQLGRACVHEMNHLGIVVDVAHAGERTRLEAIELSSKPVIVSHANVRAINDNPRNVGDEGLRALAAKGGVMGITAYSPFCETKPGVRPTLDDYIDHVAYVADLGGIDHVGVGTDFFEAYSQVRFGTLSMRYPDVFRGYTRDKLYADGFDRVDGFPRLTEGLLRRNFSDDEVRKILGGNFLRVFRQVWRS